MRGGFSFCGIDIADLGLEYAPDNASTYVYQNDYKISEQSFDGHDGAYYYGSTVQPKVFSLRCIFEEQHINHGIVSRINQTFRKGASGKLVFAKRPWIWYTATVVSAPQLQITNYLNGIVTLTLKAYYPYGRCDSVWQHEEDETIMGNSALLSEEKTPSLELVQEENVLTGQTEIILYNGGTERAAVAIELAGNVDEGVTITNRATGEKCRFVALSKAVSTDAGKYLVSDGLNGKTILTDGRTSELAFLYHDYGFISLEPAFPIQKNVHVSYVSGSSEIICQGMAGTTGKYIYLDNAWRKIAASGDESITVLPVPENTGEEETEIVTMNEITITPDSTMELTRLAFRYKPTFQ